MVALILHMPVAHLAVQGLKSVSCNYYITVVITYERAQESSFSSPDWNGIAITFLHRMDMQLIYDIVLL